MGVAELFAIVVAGGLASHAIWYVGAWYWRHAVQQRRAAALRHLDEVSRQVQELRRPATQSAPKWQAASYRRYYVPAGLHLDQARRVMREAQERAAEESNVGGR